MTPSRHLFRRTLELSAMPDTPTPTVVGPNDPGSAPTNQAGIGTEAWSDTFAAQTEDSVGAEAVVMSNSSNFLACFNYGWAIPGGATIVGIEVTIRCLTALEGAQVSCYLRGPAGTAIGAAKTIPAGIPNAYTEYVLGGLADLWGATPTPADVNDADFGAMVYCTDTGAGDLVNVDVVTMRVAYTT